MFYNYNRLYDLVPEIGKQMGTTESIIDIKYPHISKTLITLWGSPQCLKEIEELLGYTYTENRPSRQGFDLLALKELNIIMEAHMKQYPNINMNIRQGNTFW